jgi:Na+/melibiose symporter-like transporter
MAEVIAWKTKVGYGMGHVMNDMCASMWFTYLLLFFHKVLQFDNIYAGIILLIGQIADGLSTTFVGFFSDSGDDFWLCLRMGRRKSWHLIGTLCVLGSFPFIFVPCVGCSMSHEAAQLVYYASFVIMFQFGWASVQISHLSMIPEIASTQTERTGLTAIRYAMTVSSNILVYMVAWGFLNQKGRDDMIGPADQDSFRNIMLVCIGVGALTSGLFHAIIGCDQPTGSDALSSVDERAAIVERISVLEWLKEPQLYQVGLVYMSTRLFVNLSQAYIPLYLQITLQLPATYVATVPLTMFVSGFVTSFGMKWINNKIGRKATFILGAGIGVAGCLWTQYGCNADDPMTKNYVYAVAVLIGVGSSIMLVTSLSLTAEFIGPDIGSSAFIYGVMSLIDKVSNGLAVIVIQHFIPPTLDTCVLCRLYFREVLLYACGGAALLGTIGAVTLFPVVVGSRRMRPNNITVAASVNETSNESTPLLQEVRS